jgi:uncharacterized LabA/DUF88 family protein
MSLSSIASAGFGLVPQQIVSGGGGGFQPVKYLFIDAAYLRERCNEFMKAVFGVEAEIEWGLVKRSFYSLKAFYYDCLDDLPRPGEDESALKARITEQQERFYAIQSIPGFHVRFGTLTGSRPKRLRQKEVDVQLAVDMLTHAFYKNMQQATLIAGDLDFRPVVTSLIQLGTYVEVACKPEASAQNLLWAADQIFELTVDTTYPWNSGTFRERNILPARAAGVGLPMGSLLKRQGMAGNCPIKAYSHVKGYIVVIERPTGKQNLHHADLAVIDGYLKATVGEPKWREPG